MGGSIAVRRPGWFVAAGSALVVWRRPSMPPWLPWPRSSCVGLAFGLLATVQSFGNLAASAIAGLPWIAASPRVAFACLVAWMLLALAGLATAR